MEGESRRSQIMQLLSGAQNPLSGTELAKQMHVSRQVIVQDIALLRASNRNIISTSKGYLLAAAPAAVCTRTFYVCHTAEQAEEELNLIVDNGGKLLDVIVEHDIYGTITVDLFLENRRDVRDFIQKLHNSPDHPLSLLTQGKHYHTVTAAREADLEAIEQALSCKNYLISE